MERNGTFKTSNVCLFLNVSLTFVNLWMYTVHCVYTCQVLCLCSERKLINCMPSFQSNSLSVFYIIECIMFSTKLWVLVISGREEYRRVRPMSYTDADIILLCYSIGDPESHNNVATKVNIYPYILRIGSLLQPVYQSSRVII